RRPDEEVPQARGRRRARPPRSLPGQGGGGGGRLGARRHPVHHLQLPQRTPSPSIGRTVMTDTNVPWSSLAVEDINRYDSAARRWLIAAANAVPSEARRTSDYHLLQVPIPGEWAVDLSLTPGPII